MVGRCKGFDHLARLSLRCGGSQGTVWPVERVSVNGVNSHMAFEMQRTGTFSGLFDLLIVSVLMSIFYTDIW